MDEPSLQAFENGFGLSWKDHVDSLMEKLLEKGDFGREHCWAWTLQAAVYTITPNQIASRIASANAQRRKCTQRARFMGEAGTLITFESSPGLL